MEVSVDMIHASKHESQMAAYRVRSAIRSLFDDEHLSDCLIMPMYDCTSAAAATGASATELAEQRALTSGKSKLFAHRCILALRSPYFFRLFAGKLTERDEKQLNIHMRSSRRRATSVSSSNSSDTSLIFDKLLPVPLRSADSAAGQIIAAVADDDDSLTGLDEDVIQATSTDSQTYDVSDDIVYNANSNGNGNGNEVPIVRVPCSAGAMYVIMGFIYQDRLPDHHLSQSLMSEVNSLAEMYELSGLQDILRRQHVVSSHFGNSDTRSRVPAHCVLQSKSFFQIDLIESWFEHPESDAVNIRTASGVTRLSVVLLTMHSNFFRRMFSASWYEAKSGEVELLHTPCSFLKSLVAYAVHGDLPDIDDLDTAQDFFLLCNFFESPSMQEAIEERLLGHFMTPKTVCQLWQFLDNHSQEASEVCQQFFEKNLVEVSFASNYFALPKRLLSRALNSGRIRLRTSYVLEAVVRWVDANSQDSDVRREELSSLLPPSVLFNSTTRNQIMAGIRPQELSINHLL
jgi:BTB/POZ domain/BTB And C-terminal Kelch